VLVWNKIDLTPVMPGLDRDEYGKICRVNLSAKTGAGLGFLRDALTEVAVSKKSAAISPETMQHDRDTYVT
jgi:GTP-binding protein HflX